MGSNLINSNDNHDGDNEELKKAIDSLPSGKRELVEKTFIGLLAKSSESAETIFAKKLTDKNIQQYLENDAKRDEYIYESNKENNHKQKFCLVVFSVVVIVLVILLRDKPDVMERLITVVVGCAVGFVGGYGYGSKNNE